jgi:predicted AAA+ superfamily ATPase
MAESAPLFRRTMEPHLRRMVRQYPVVFLTGPRQSGKTTLSRVAFPRFAYSLLEDIDEREFARADPRGFLARFDGKQGVVLDEVQRVPELFSYLQGIADRPRSPRMVLTGSQQFQLSRRIGQTLAGRAAVLSLFPLSVSELSGRRPVDPARLDRVAPGAATPALDLNRILFSGMYPRIHAHRLAPREWLSGYVQTYVERDVRDVLNIGDLEAFDRFLMLMAGRTGQLLNLSSLASDCGISQPTARRWVSVLEASGVVALLRPHHANFRKRLVKSPKAYFLDTGLACFLLGLRSPRDLEAHPLHGPLFETLVVSEVYKAFAHRGERPPLFFWRDRTGHEVDIVVDLGRRTVPVEVKLSRTVRSDAFRGLDLYTSLAGVRGGVLVHGGEATYRQGAHVVRSWLACS